MTIRTLATGEILPFQTKEGIISVKIQQLVHEIAGIIIESKD